LQELYHSVGREDATILRQAVLCVKKYFHSLQACLEAGGQQFETPL
jgi:hypothetical protein